MDPCIIYQLQSPTRPLCLNMHKRTRAYTHRHGHTPSCTHRHTSVAHNTFLEWQNPLLPFVMCYRRCSHHFVTPLCLSILPMCCLRSFIQISITFSLVAGLGCSFNVYVYSDAPPSLSLLAPTSSSLPHSTRVSSFCYEPRFHNNCDLSIMPNHF